MRNAISGDALDQIFRSARTYQGWTDTPIQQAIIRNLYELLKWGLTSTNSSPTRFVWVRSAEGKAKLAARALGLDCGPMSGFDNAGVDKAFFSGTRIQSNFICNIGYGDPTSVFPCNPRLSFEEAGPGPERQGHDARDRIGCGPIARNGEILMSTEKNIQTVKNFFAAVSRGDREGKTAPRESESPLSARSCPCRANLEMSPLGP